MLRSHGGFSTIAIYHHREQYNKFNARENGSRLTVRAKENLELRHGGPSYNKAPGTNAPIKVLYQSHR